MGLIKDWWTQQWTRKVTVEQQLASKVTGGTQQWVRKGLVAQQLARKVTGGGHSMGLKVVVLVDTAMG